MVYRLFFAVAVVCFLGNLAADIAYVLSTSLMWLHFAEWLNATGLAFGAVAAVALLITFIARPAFRRHAYGWTHLVVFYAALGVELCNAFVHTADGWTAVVPAGLTLSIVGAVLALVAVGTLFALPLAWRDYREVRL